MKTKQQQSLKLNNFIDRINPQLPEDSEEIDADYEVIESSILTSLSTGKHTEKAQQTVREIDFDWYLAGCEVEMKNGISASLEPIPLPEPVAPDMTIYNLNAILDGLLDDV